MKKLSPLKILGFIFMIIDHAGIVLFPELIVLRLIGRLGSPIFAYTTAVGFLHTHNRKDYIKRLFIFAFFSQIPYYLSINPSNLNIGFTLLFSVITLNFIESENKWYRYGGILACILVFLVVPMDYGISYVIMIVSFYVGLKRNTILYAFIVYPFVLLIIWMSYGASIAIMQSFYLGGLFIIWYLKDIYISLPAGRCHSLWKKFSYSFYPVHLIVLYLINFFLKGMLD